MRLFAQLIEILDGTNKTNKKVAALANYFQKAADPDKVLDELKFMLDQKDTD